MACSQEIDKQKKYLKFIVQVLLTLDEEMVDKGYGHDEVSNNVKDGIRAGPIGDICSLLG